MADHETDRPESRGLSRRSLLTKGGLLGAVAALGGAGVAVA
jgi:hypothetical protein